VSKPTNLTHEKLRRTIAKLRRAQSEHEDEVRKSQLKRTLSKLARERRERKKGRTGPRLSVVTK